MDVGRFQKEVGCIVPHSKETHPCDHAESGLGTIPKTRQRQRGG